MRSILVIVVFSISFILSGQENSLDNKFGFKTIKFNSEVNDLTYLIYLKTEYGTTYYEHKPVDDNLYSVFDVVFDRIILGFYNNKLTHIQLQKKIKNNVDSRGHKESLRLLNHLKNDFEPHIGKCKTSSSDTSIIHFWEENRVGLVISSKLDVDSSTIDDLGNLAMVVSNDVIFYLKGELKTNGY